ncbi:MAG: FliO/MopB family protein [Phycisphaerae bacterium]|nr:FliO/MopB family protein [Phycisphaerae bacterium]
MTRSATQPAPKRGDDEVAGRRDEGLHLKDGGGIGPVWEMLAYTIILLVLAGVGIYVARRFLPRIGTQAGKRVSVEETVALGPRKSVHLLRVAGRRYLVSSSREQITLLADVTDAVADDADAAAADGAIAGETGAGDFGAVLNRQATSDPKREDD